MVTLIPGLPRSRISALYWVRVPSPLLPGSSLWTSKPTVASASWSVQADTSLKTNDGENTSHSERKDTKALSQLEEMKDT